MKDLAKEWIKIENNIFGFSNRDAFLYIFLYILVPVLLTLMDFSSSEKSTSSAIYSYACLFINTANCLYDITNRWEKIANKVMNIKLLVMGISAGIVCFYSLAEIIITARLNSLQYSFDGVLFFYLILIFIALIDAFCCFGRRIIVYDQLKG